MPNTGPLPSTAQLYGTPAQHNIEKIKHVNTSVAQFITQLHMYSWYYNQLKKADKHGPARDTLYIRKLVVHTHELVFGSEPCINKLLPFCPTWALL